MAPVTALDRIQQKVWDGEPLTEEELEALRRAAQNDAGPTLRTAVAQALINADAPLQALPLLEAVQRDFPRDVEALLALGRALISLEKWSQAEAPLKRAHELSPDDPEPRKALAVLAMRRGEWARAKAWVEEVLKVDLLDTEAQQLLTTLEQAAPAELVAKAPLEEFTRALLRALDEHATPHLVQKDQLIVRAGKGAVLRLRLEELYESYLDSASGLEAALPAIIRELDERSTAFPHNKLVFLAKVLPVLRDASFLERSRGAVRREGPAGLFVYYTLDDAEVVHYVPEGVLASYRLSLEQLDRAAWRNLDVKPAQVRPIALEDGHLRLCEAPTGLWALATGDAHDAARLLTPRHQEALAAAAGPGPWRAYLGLRELVLCCREREPALRQLAGLDASKGGIAGAWRLDGGKLTAVPDWDV